MTELVSADIPRDIVFTLLHYVLDSVRCRSIACTSRRVIMMELSRIKLYKYPSRAIWCEHEIHYAVVTVKTLRLVCRKFSTAANVKYLLAMNFGGPNKMLTFRSSHQSWLLVTNSILGNNLDLRPRVQAVCENCLHPTCAQWRKQISEVQERITLRWWLAPEFGGYRKRDPWDSERIFSLNTLPLGINYHQAIGRIFRTRE
jgi:hypothetical protein